VAQLFSLGHITHVMNIGMLPLYKREQWDRWVALFINTDSPMTPTFDEWFKDHQEDLANYKRQGHDMHIVEVDIDLFVAWARKKSVPFNAKARADYTMQLLIERMRDSGDLNVA